MYHTPPPIDRSNENCWFAIEEKTGDVKATTTTLDELEKIAERYNLYPTCDWYKHSWYGKEIPPWSRFYKGKKSNNLTIDV